MKTFRFLLALYIFIIINTKATLAENTGNDAFCSFLPEKYIYKETSDSIIFISGLTQVFTVDTPENEGLTSTTLRVEQLVNAMYKDAEAHYRIFNSSGLERIKGSFE